MKQILFKTFLIFTFIASLNAKELDKVNLRLDWLHQFQFAGYYIAKEKGYFEEYGLDVNIKEVEFGINQLEEISNNTVQYSIGKSSLIIDKINGKNIVALAAIFQHSPMVLVTTDLSIKEPKDLLNKNVMLTPDARTAVAINSMISAQGLDLKDVNFQAHSFKLEDLISGKTDAMGAYLSNEPYILQEKNIKYNVLDPKDYGFDFYGGILFTSKNELVNNTNRVYNFRKAALKGWKYAFENIPETVNLIISKYNTQNKSYLSLLYEGQILRDLAEIEKGKLGNINKTKINEIMKIYSLLGYKYNSSTLNNFNINENDILLSNEEKEYLEKNIINYVSYLTPPFSRELGNESIEYDYLQLIRNKISIDIKNNIREPEKSNFHNIKSKEFQTYTGLSKNANNIKDSILTKTVTQYDVAIATQINKAYIPSMEILNNKKVAIRKTCLFKDDFKIKYPEINFTLVDNVDEALNLLSKNEVYAVIDALPTLTYKIQQMSLSNLKIAGTTAFKYNLRYIVHKDDKILLSILNKTIEKINQKEKSTIDLKYSYLNYVKILDNSLLFKIGIPLLIIILIIIIANLKLSKEIKRRKKAELTLEDIANTDMLTGVCNRRNISQKLSKDIAISQRYNRDLSIIFFDIDSFKTINDTFGHEIGDDILKEISKIVKENIRNSDSFGRWGGEEFLIILPETSQDQAKIITYNLRNLINKNSFKVCCQVTCSFGVTQLKSSDTINTFIYRADKAMYYIKENGKNEVKVD